MTCHHCNVSSYVMGTKADVCRRGDSFSEEVPPVRAFGP